MTALPALVLLALAALLARRPSRPLCAALWGLLAADVARAALAALVLAPARLRLGGAPYGGLPRVAFHAEQALHLAWPFVALGLCGHLLTEVRRRAWGFAAILWGSVALGFAATYPAVRGEDLIRGYRGVQAVACGLAAVTSVLGRRPPGFRAGPEHLAALLLVAGCAAELAGPYLHAGGPWWLAQVTWPLALAGVCLALARGRPWATARA